MRYVMFTYLSPEDVEAWRGWTEEEQRADVDRHIAWFTKFRDKVVGGEELDEVAHVKTLRRGRQGEGVVVTDGPYVETKELLGGFVVLEVGSEEEAIAIASEWPSLRSQAGATVQLQPVYVRE
jgi:hypothetical protein